MGDPAGIGPEILVKAWQVLRNNSEIRFVLIGDLKTIADECERQNIAPPKLIKFIGEDFDFSTQIAVLCPKELPQEAILGCPNTANAEAIIGYIATGTQLCIDGSAKAIVTLPISKSVLYESGFEFGGHTEFIAHLCSLSHQTDILPIMMLMAENVRVALATIHIPLSSVAASLNSQQIEFTIRSLNDALKNDFAIQSPKIAILGLNPHAGENGDIGREEIEIINPICEKLRAEGIDCTNAIPADSAFSPEKRAYFDAYVAMYHDQGLIPIKTIDFWGGVNVTLGLPIVRTSPDHGTGFEIAGKNTANPQSFINAIKAANQIYENRLKVKR